VGKQPANLARWIYQITPSYAHGPFAIGFNLIGQSDSFVDNLDTTIEPGWVEVNLFARYDFTSGIQLSIRGNNLLNAIGLTEVESANVGRSINGRTFEGTFKYSF
jgi:outer membrane receptor protein involved in Fe transport